MCHEQKNFILIIIDYLKSLQKDETKKDQQDQINDDKIKKILNICNFQKFMIQDFFDNSKIENDQFVLHPSEFDLNECMNDISDMFSQKLKDKNIEIKIKEKPPLNPIKNDLNRL